MFPRPSLAASLPLPLFSNSSCRSMATLKDIQVRLKSIKNISKITKSMKMIASTKLSKAQKAMESGRVFGSTVSGFYDTVKPSADKADDVPLLIAVSSDRGLCGAIHSSISKQIRKVVREDCPTAPIVVLGDKAKPQISREARNNIVAHFNQLGRDIPVFADAANIVDTLVRENFPLNFVQIHYNQFKSVISYDNSVINAYFGDKLETADGFSAFEVDDEVLNSFSSYLFASQLFWALSEGHAAEMAAKRTAMENATKNAGEMIVKLTMKYNRTRQAVITNELVDIITGASAL